MSMKDSDGCICVKTNMAAIVGEYGEGMSMVTFYKNIEDLAAHLRNSGY